MLSFSFAQTYLMLINKPNGSGLTSDHFADGLFGCVPFSPFSSGLLNVPIHSRSDELYLEADIAGPILNVTLIEKIDENKCLGHLWGNEYLLQVKNISTCYYLNSMFSLKSFEDLCSMKLTNPYSSSGHMFNIGSCYS